MIRKNEVLKIHFTGEVVTTKGNLHKIGTHGYRYIGRDLVHRIVAKEYLPNPDNLPEINHKDGDKLNNHVSNLEWCTSAQNLTHAYSVGLNKGRGKLNSLQIRIINRCELPQRYLAEVFNVTQPTICNVNKRKYVEIQV